jgi:transcriptional regulator
MTTSQPDFLQGTLDLLILRTLAQGPNHGWAVAQQIQKVSNDILQVNQGSLYPALQRLELRGWIESEWKKTERNRRAKFYNLTPLGEAELETVSKQWRRFAVAVELVLQSG